MNEMEVESPEMQQKILDVVLVTGINSSKSRGATSALRTAFSTTGRGIIYTW